MISLDLSRVTENSTLISVLMTCSSAWMEAALLDPNGDGHFVRHDGPGDKPVVLPMWVIHTF